MAVSSRLASMGFMKRAKAADKGQGERQGQGEQQQQQHQLQQNQQQQPPPKKVVLSDKLAGMKFMQRGAAAAAAAAAGAQKRGYEDAIGSDEAAKQAAQWVAQGVQQPQGCVVIQERDPLPPGCFGRFSFGQANAEVEAAGEVAEALAAGRSPPPQQQQHDADEPDELDALPARWASSLRMDRNKKRQKRR